MASRNQDELLTVSEAAEYLNVSVSTMRRWLRARSIEHIQVGRTIRLRRSVLERWLRDHTQLPTDYAALL
jgi:excisionase family DNA binding protein